MGRFVFEKPYVYGERSLEGVESIINYIGFYQFENILLYSLQTIIKLSYIENH